MEKKTEKKAKSGFIKFEEDKVSKMPDSLLVGWLRDFQHAAETNQQIADVIKTEFLKRLVKEGVDGKKIDDYILSKVNRVVFDTPVEKAQEFGATKLVKDDAVLKKLYAQGIKIPGVRVSTFLRVSEFKEETNNDN